MTQGMFGEVQVRDTLFARELLISGQVQGGAYFSPAANTVNECLSEDAPGPACTSVYALGWLIAGAASPMGTGVMIGLGSGAGAVQLLYNFPGVDLTIVEIDPIVVRLALKAYPLLEYYLNKGRLNIVIKDAKKYFLDQKDVFDFACADAYTGEAELKTGYLNQLCDRADNIYLNVIDSLQGESMSRVTRLLADKGKPVRDLFKAVQSHFNIPYASKSNWILTTQDVPWNDLAVFEPFPEFDDAARIVRREWDNLLSSALSALI